MTDTIHARAIVVLGDCHIHPAKGVDWPLAALDAFEGADLFVTLGDMGERAGLDTLARLAPVIGVHGRDDEDDPRTAAKLRVLEAGGLRIGCVFDPVRGRRRLADRATGSGRRPKSCGSCSMDPWTPCSGPPRTRRRSSGSTADCSSTRAARPCRARTLPPALPD